MINIYELLVKYNLTIPEDKKAEFEEAFKANYKTVAEVEKITTARDNYKSQLETAQTALKEFEGVDVKELQGKGIAKLMIEKIKAEARSRGFLYSRHLAYAEDPVASGMYDHLGYRYMGTTHLYGSDYKIYEGKL